MSSRLDGRNVNRTICLILLIWLAGQRHIKAKDLWVSAEAPHFILYTTGTAENATRLLAKFEQARSIFLQTSLGAAVPETKVTIVAFSSQQEYEPYRANPGASAYYQRNSSGDYIVIQSLEPQNERIALHEYAHCILRHAGLRLPLWLNEGLAEVYSSLQTDGLQSSIGAALPGHIYTLQHRSGLDLQTMFQVDRQSAYYSRPEQMWVFYAHSWALAHMLLVDNRYSAHFADFVSSLSKGQPASEAMKSAYGKDVAQVEKDLELYLQQEHLPRLTLSMSVAATLPVPVISTPRDVDVSLTLTNLVSTHLYAQSGIETKTVALAQAR